MYPGAAMEITFVSVKWGLKRTVLHRIVGVPCMKWAIWSVKTNCGRHRYVRSSCLPRIHWVEVTQQGLQQDVGISKRRDIQLQKTMFATVSNFDTESSSMEEQKEDHRDILCQFWKSPSSVTQFNIPWEYMRLSTVVYTYTSMVSN